MAFLLFFRNFADHKDMNQATRQFIHDHAEADVHQLALRGTKDPDVDLTFALEQIAGRQRAMTKLPTWAAIEGITFPPHLAMEQCSSEQTARYKAKVIEKSLQKHQYFVDLTGGFGVDFSFIAPLFDKAVYVEQQSQLCAISLKNFKLLGIVSDVVNADGIEVLHTLSHVDMVFMDPARRDEHGARTYGLADCIPNVLAHIDELMEKTDNLMLKLSPMLDWWKTVDDIQQTGSAKVNVVHLVSVDNECKELLLQISKTETPLQVCCVNNDNLFEFFVTETTIMPSSSLEHPVYLYEPNASVMKAGCFDLLAERFGVSQLARNSHLFVSDTVVKEFPGRQFCIERVSSMNKRDLKVSLQGIDKANITVRNFPLSVSDLRKRLKLKDGGDVFIFATTLANRDHKLLICRKTSYV